MLNTIGYDPYDDTETSNGFRRPPKDPRCLADYIGALSMEEDNCELLLCELQELISDPDVFFAPTHQNVDPISVER